MVLFAIYLHLLQGGSDGDQSVIYEQETLKTKVGCNVVKASCPSYGKGVSVFLKLDSNPSGLKAFPVEVQIDGMAKENIQKVLVSFKMKNMTMGKLNHKLTWNADASQWEGVAILPICSTGRRDWYVSVEAMGNAVIYTARYDFVLQ